MRTSDQIVLQQQIVRFFPEKLNLEPPSPDVDLFASEVLDSVSFIELLLLLEQEFGIRVSLNDLELENFRSIEKIAEFVFGPISK